MSVYNESLDTVGIIARAVNGEKPKYRVISGNSNLHFPHIPSRQVVVVVEDILSSIALARAGLDSVALLGTSLQGVDAHRIAHNREAVIGFFDPDKAGHQAYRRLRAAMQLHPVSVYKASADKDPKYLSKDKLWRAINHALNVQELKC